MAPAVPGLPSEQLTLLSAAQKLSDAVSDAGVPPNEFAEKLLELMELTAKIQQFEEVAALASQQATSDEAQKWQEISLMTLKHCSAHLYEQRQKTLRELQTLGQNGATLFKAPVSSAAPLDLAVKPPPGLESPSAPPGFKALSGLKVPPGIGAPPGLGVPPGLGFDTPVEEAPVVKKKWSAANAPWHKKKSSPSSSPMVTAHEQPAATPACAVMNLDAYDSD